MNLNSHTMGVSFYLHFGGVLPVLPVSCYNGGMKTQHAMNAHPGMGRRGVLFVFRFLVVCSVCTCVHGGEPEARGAGQRPLRVLAIGNSYTQSLVPEFPQVARAAGCSLDLAILAIGGNSLSNHWMHCAAALADPAWRPYFADGRKTNLPEMLAAKTWDVVTLQEQSADGMDPEKFDPWADRLIAFVRSRQPQARIFFQQTWSDTVASWRITDNGVKGALGLTQDGMFAALEKNYAFQAARLGARLIPVGKALQIYRRGLPVRFTKPTAAELAALKEGEVPDMKGELSGWWEWSRGRPYEKDYGVYRLRQDFHHLNPEGRYLQACVWTAALFGVDLANLGYAPDLGADFARRAPFIRACAMKAVKEVGLAEGTPSGGRTFRIERNIRYSGASTNCVLDVKWPAGATNCAVVVNLHGGGLTGGAKQFAPWPEEAQGHDAIVFVGAGYRLLRPDNDAVKPADCLADAAAAVAWTFANIARYGGDPKKVFLTGISAGGYLTAMVGMDARWLAPHGFRPGDLAGIVPLTGQMTKHFNVRKLGFKDPDPQFQPKIDAWAPLFYAHAKGLPPACFCTGGRDLEWRGRVEENELLARALRDCGYPRTEFHETEGDHGGGVLESAYHLRDFVMKTVEADGVARLADGERVVFFGDSITHDGRYVYNLQLFQNLRRPGSGTRLLNGGISGDSAAGGVGRWRDDILPMRPDRAFVMFGMNDVGRDLYATATPTDVQAKGRAAARARYEANLRALAALMPTSGVKTVFVTPSPYNQYSLQPERENLAQCNEPGLAACADRVRALAAERHFGVVDLHAPMTAMFKAHPAFAFCRDRVHPGAEGHLVMAALLAEAMRYSSVVARAAIDAETGRARPLGARDGSRNCTLTRVQASPRRVAFTYAPKALPFPKLPEYERVDGAFYPLTARLNQEPFVVTGLADGRYTLAFDGRPVGVFTAAALAQGVNVALLDTPNQRRAREAARPMAELQHVNARLRTFALVCGMLRRNKVDPSDPAAAEAWLADWLARHAESRYLGAFQNWAKTYREVAPVQAALEAQVEDLYERMAAVRPAVSRVTIEMAD